MNGNNSLRYYLSLLKDNPKELIEINEIVDCDSDIAGIYRNIGAGGTVKRPTKLGPAVLFNKVKGFPDSKVIIGILGTRERVGQILNSDPAKIGWKLLEAIKTPKKPVIVNKPAACHEQVFLAEDKGFDVRKIVPAPKNTEKDAGPYITMGLVHIYDKETGEGNISVHRICIQNEKEMTIGIAGTRHLAFYREKARKEGRPLAVSINIGVDPAIYIAASLQAPATPYGVDELSVAGGLRNEPVELVKCVSIDQYAIANAEYVIEGEIDLEKRMREDSNTNSGLSLPEFSGYNGEARDFPVVNVKAVTCRRNPIMQVCIGASEEHVNMAGISLEASILAMTSQALPGIVENVFCPSCGGGKLMAILQVRKKVLMDEGKQKQAALLAFSSYLELKNVFLVDDDVDPFDISDVMWAMNTRFRPDKDLTTISNIRCHKADPTEKKFYDPTLIDEGLGIKCIYDCTVPFPCKKDMERSVFKEVDMNQYI